MKKIKLLNLVTLMLFLGIFYACRDSGTGAGNGKEHGQTPTLPDLKTYTMVDLSYFKSNNPNSDVNIAGAQFSNYSIGRSWAMGTSSMFLLSTTFISTFTNASQADATFTDDVWIWHYGYNQASWTLKAFPGEAWIEWALFVTIHTDEVNFDNYKFMNGKVSKDGLEGSWQFNSFTEASKSYLTFEWKAESKTNRSLTAKFYDDNGSLLSTTNYTVDDAVNKIIFTNANNDQAGYTIGWNVETSTGYYIDTDDIKHCWDSSFQNVAC